MQAEQLGQAVGFLAEWTEVGHFEFLGKQPARLAAHSIYPPANSEPTDSRGLPTPVLGTFPAIIDVSELFSGIEIRPHILNAAIYPRIIRLFENERAPVVGEYPRLGSCR
jgi:hypothetical protein